MSPGHAIMITYICHFSHSAFRSRSAFCMPHSGLAPLCSAYWPSTNMHAPVIDKGENL